MLKPNDNKTNHELYFHREVIQVGVNVSVSTDSPGEIKNLCVSPRGWPRALVLWNLGQIHAKRVYVLPVSGQNLNLGYSNIKQLVETQLIYIQYT